MSENTTKTLVFLDTVGRTILGELVSQDATTTTVNNPVILNIIPAEGGRMTVQLYPVFFREFLADKTADVSFTYQNNSIVPTSIEAIDFRLMAQYAQMFNKDNVLVPAGTQPQAQTAPVKQNNNAVINLFDE